MYESSRDNIEVTWSDHRKTLWTQNTTIFVQRSWNFFRMYVFMTSVVLLYMSFYESNIKPLYPIEVKRLEHSRGFFQFLFKSSWNFFRKLVLLTSMRLSFMDYLQSNTKSTYQIIENAHFSTIHHDTLSRRM